MQLTKQQIDYCMECGVCTGSCPVSYDLPGFSPRQMIKRTLVEPDGDILKSKDIWACLSCSRCSDRCPVGIDFPEFIRTYREKAIAAGNLPRESHHGVFQTLTTLQSGDLKQNRISWAEESGKIQEKGDYFFFVGCLPYQDVVFKYLDLQMIDSAKSILKVLNKMGIEPVVSNNERCCGHDAFWSGNEQLFAKLAKKNVETIKASGAKTVIFSCPEGYSIFMESYPAIVGELPFEIIHISEFLARELPKADVSFNPSGNGSVTYHDPCRLGRRAGIYEEPRSLLGLIPDSDLREMENNRENAVCCGTTAWMECSSCSKTMQIKRLQEAERAGAGTIITACPKCQIHLSCAKSNTDIDVEVKDLYSYLSENIELEK
ncbi:MULTISPECIES: (Fe-S)-binding protein [Desulfosediminicola]|uniref:(Fe-S)-binding protein n=1 Tax=Desulfosediminicola TaxID=2886823 RepID=UPI0010ABB24A|nr:(Fe-S)-binding protein [Desulfosediminicola ganghwensis]